MYKERDIETLWSKYEMLLSKLEDESINNLIEKEGERILMTSYSQREKEPFCGIGGIVEYALELAKVANKISDALNYGIYKKTIIRCALLSVLGRVGTISQNRFKDTESEWHRDKLGQYFDWNEDCPKYQINDMTLYLLQHYDVKLSWEEWNAIMLLRDSSSEESKFYGGHKSRLATVLTLAHEAVIKDELDKIAGIYTVPF